jgi:ankyrin repeat protein
MTPLIVASLTGQVAVVAELLYMGASAKVTLSAGRSALSLAKRKRLQAIVALLERE